MKRLVLIFEWLAALSVFAILFVLFMPPIFVGLVFSFLYRAFLIGFNYGNSFVDNPFSTGLKEFSKNHDPSLN